MLHVKNIQLSRHTAFDSFGYKERVYKHTVISGFK